MTNHVIILAENIVKKIKPFSSKIEIAGSIRRHKPNPRDIDIVLIPKDKTKIEQEMSKLGKFIQGGDQRSRWKIKGIQTELYYTNEKEWGATLLAYSGKKGAQIGLRIIARLKGFKLNQHGLYNRKTGKLIASKTEHGIYKALGRPYKLPENR